MKFNTDLLIARSKSARVAHALVLAAILPMVALANLPARDEDILCGSTDVVVGTVMQAVRSDPAHVDTFCGYKPWNCDTGAFSSCQSDPHQITLRIKVSKMLGTIQIAVETPMGGWYTRAEQVNISVGDTIDVTSQLINDVCHAGTEDHQGWFSVNPPVKGASPAESLSPELLREFYVGKQFIFSLRAIRLIGLLPNSPYSDQPPGTFSSNIWRMGRLAWVKTTLKGWRASCPKPLPR